MRQQNADSVSCGSQCCNCFCNIVGISFADAFKRIPCVCACVCSHNAVETCIVKDKLGSGRKPEYAGPCPSSSGKENFVSLSSCSFTLLCAGLRDICNLHPLRLQMCAYIWHMLIAISVLPMQDQWWRDTKGVNVPVSKARCTQLSRLSTCISGCCLFSCHHCDTSTHILLAPLPRTDSL